MNDIILNILLIEDDNNDAELIVRHLGEALPANVLVRKTFGEGATLLAQESGPINLVLLDLTLPDLSGEQLVKKIRDLTEVPIIIITGDVSLDTARMVVRAGADSYLVKGEYNKNELRRIITMAVGRRERDVIEPRLAQTEKLKSEQAQLATAMRESEECLTEALENISRLKRCLGLA